MLDWWFNWHPLEGLRYAIWCPIAHTDISAETPHAHLDPQLSGNDPLFLPLYIERHNRLFDKVTKRLAKHLMLFS
jgi:DAPG hydrolase PhiG domain